MGPEATPGHPGPAAARHRLGTYLRAQRQKNLLGIERVAAHVGIVPSTLSRIETGYAPLRTSYLYLLLDLYGVTGDAERSELAELARQGQCQPYRAQHDDLIPEGTANYLDLEASATLIRTYAPQIIPEQVMTPAYASAASRVMRLDLRRPRYVAFAELAQARQEQLWRGRCRIQALIDQRALRQPIAPANLITAQLRHLAALTGPAVTVQVIPPQNQPPVISPPFTVLTLTGQPHDAGCCHGPAGQITVSRRLACTRAMNATWEALIKTALTPPESAALLSELACR